MHDHGARDGHDEREGHEVEASRRQERRHGERKHRGDRQTVDAGVMASERGGEPLAQPRVRHGDRRPGIVHEAPLERPIAPARDVCGDHHDERRHAHEHGERYTREKTAIDHRWKVERDPNGPERRQSGDERGTSSDHTNQAAARQSRCLPKHPFGQRSDLLGAGVDAIRVHRSPLDELRRRELEAFPGLRSVRVSE